MAITFTDSFLDALRDRIDMVELVSRHVTLKRSGGNWLGLCPFHDEKTPSFSVRPDRGFYKCFGCGAGGDAIAFLMQIKGATFPEAVEELAAISGLPLPESRPVTPEQSRQRRERQEQYTRMERIARYFSEQLQHPPAEGARRYLQKRGLSRRSIERFGIGFAPPGWSGLIDHFAGGRAALDLLEPLGLVIRKESGNAGYDRFRNRIIFPIRDLRGRCIAFGGRAMNPEEPKYINSPETVLFNKSRTLFGLNLAQEAIRREGSALVVEGYMDVISLAEHGISNSVAPLGTALTSDHLQMLWSRTHRILFCFDGDTAGRKAAWRAAERTLDGLDADRHAGFVFLPDGVDPDDMVRREGADRMRDRLVNSAHSLRDLLFSKMGEGLDLEGPEGRAATMHRALPFIERIRDPLLRALYVEEFRSRLHLPESWQPAQGGPGQGGPGQG
ncbi:MAG: DNA primase, partial [Magnetococcales bacterium]|nr:DNA primase [Magnetococcales bacterium]